MKRYKRLKHRKYTMNNSEVQYITRTNNLKYTTKRFDESLAGTRLSLKEVNEQIARIHEHVDNFKKQKYSNFCCLLIFLLCVLYEFKIIKDVFSSRKSTEIENTPLYFLMGPLFVLTLAALVRRSLQNFTYKYTKDIRLFLIKENLERWHQRGIHWSMPANLNLIEINFTYNPKTGQLRQPQMLIGFYNKNQKQATLKKEQNNSKIEKLPFLNHQAKQFSQSYQIQMPQPQQSFQPQNVHTTKQQRKNVELIQLQKENATIYKI